MQLKILPLVCLFLISFMLQGLNAQERFGFDDFEYSEESVTWGSVSKSTYFFPINEKRFIANGSTLYLNLKTSDVLNAKRSFVTIAINNIPVATKSPEPSDSSINFVIPLSANSVNSGFLRVDVISKLRIDEELCEFYGEGAFWLRRLPSSHLDLNLKSPETSEIKGISDFLNEASTILLPEEVSLTTMKYAAYIQYYFKNELNRNLSIKSIPNRSDSIPPGSILLGLLKEINSDEKFDVEIDTPHTESGLVKLYRLGAENKPFSKNKSKILLVTGQGEDEFEKAAQSLLEKDLISSAYTDSYFVKEGKSLGGVSVEVLNEINFRELGVNEEITEGVGRIQKEIELPRAIFPPGLSKLKLNLKFTYRPLEETESAYLNLYMDDVLKHSYSLNSSGSFERMMDFTGVKSKDKNKLKIEYYFIPEGKECIRNPTTFYAQLDLDASEFKAEAFEKEKQLSFDNFTQTFFRNKPVIYWDVPNSPRHTASLSLLLDKLNPELAFKKKHVFPDILPIDSLKTRGNTNSSIIITSQSESLEEFAEGNSFLNIRYNQYEFKKEDYSRFFEVSYTDRIGISQLFEVEGQDFMFIYDPDGNPAILNQIIEKIASPYLDNYGDLILASEDDSYFFSLMNEQKITKKEIESNFQNFWNKYSLIIIFVLLILLIVILIYIFQKSQESKNNIIGNE
ncbi:cellulose biosynthesis cyclic di-GMP-binding regulatory protein BcsB [Psychroflexus sp. YR1-1]|uniref:Cellulose biosynthesis cyclic di-GMP-binding regulatory protein BcsB n=1 Tax=Psychroflexus aurantiacus TaxID=2709310 RepID=A0A6B3R3B2_9FLAO|nr:cellulose biosynthesis cyclic di-GMP-binding regulatory protein BcsB [Psychroflexus aurantiacus]NEV94528.1 cellulose biosynthesis cyclic di-GMP-binding regulatory protein BcsB [Psychroflexus aurantiacus]